MKHTYTHTHTPGPWRYAPGEIVYGPSGESVASCRFVTNFKDTNVANMRLVAAAPDLLAALQETLVELGEYMKICPNDKALDLAGVIAGVRRALIKAEGVK